MPSALPLQQQLDRYLRVVRALHVRYTYGPQVPNTLSLQLQLDRGLWQISQARHASYI